MSVLKLIATHINLQSDQLKNLSEEEIIRIEKQLKAEVNLNQSLNLNEVDLILRMLRNHRKELEILFRSVFNNFRQILMCTDEFFVSQDALVLAIHPDENIAKFISDYFGKDLFEYASRCIKHEHYNALNTLLIYSELLPVLLLEDVSKKCLYKIEYTTECINIRASNLSQKTESLRNPFFYRSLNKLGAAQFQNSLIDFYNAFVNSPYLGFETNMRGAYAFGFYKSSHSRFQELLLKNQQNAFERGAREICYDVGETNNKGGTYMLVAAQDTDLADRVRRYSQNGGKNNSSTNQVDWRASTSGDGNSVFSLLLGLGALVLVIIVFSVGIGSSRNNNFDNEYLDFEIPEIPTQPMFQTTSLEVVETDSLLFSINQKAAYFQALDSQITKERNIDFDIDRTNMSSPYQGGLTGQVTFVNETEKPVIILLYGFYSLFLEPGKSDSTSMFEKFCVYTGTEPQMISYKDTLGITQKDFRFKNFTEQDEISLRRVYELSNPKPFGEYKILITDSAGKIQLLLRDKTWETIF